MKEQINEIGDTPRGRGILNRYIDKRMSQAKDLNRKTRGILDSSEKTDDPNRRNNARELARRNIEKMSRWITGMNRADRIIMGESNYTAQDLKNHYKSILSEMIGADYPDTKEGRAMLARHHKKLFNILGKSSDREKAALLARSRGMNINTNPETGELFLNVPTTKITGTKVSSVVRGVPFGSNPTDKTLAGDLKSALGGSRGEVRIPNQPSQVDTQIDAIRSLRGPNAYTGPRRIKRKRSR